jgi:polyisoprenoid-binding protein YceI
MLEGKGRLSAAMQGLQTRHPFPTIALHWIGAALVVALAATGYAMTRLAPGDPGQFTLYQLHKTLGVAALLLAVARLAAAARRQPRWAMRRRDRGARAVQAALLALALVVPMSGWALVSASRLDMPILLAGFVEFPRIESLRAISPEAKSLFEPRLSTMHAALAWALVALAAAHALAALHRHFVLGDKVLRRMLPVLAAASVAAMSPAAATTWIVDPARSTLGFAGLETGNRFAGRFGRWSADVAFDPAQPQGMQVRVVVDIGSAATGDGRRDTLMLGDDWLDASGFPRARFEATGARALDAGRYEARGTLALRDRIRPVAIEFTLEVADGEARARGTASILRTEFGVGRGMWSGIQVVAPEVLVSFDLVARPAP